MFVIINMFIVLFQNDMIASYQERLTKDSLLNSFDDITILSDYMLNRIELFSFHQNET